MLINEGWIKDWKKPKTHQFHYGGSYSKGKYTYILMWSDFIGCGYNIIIDCFSKDEYISHDHNYLSAKEDGWNEIKIIEIEKEPYVIGFGKSGNIYLCKITKAYGFLNALEH